MSLPEPSRSVEATAAAWYGRKRSGAITMHEAQALEAWLEIDAAHRAAFDEVDYVWSLAAAARTDPNAMELREAVAKAYPRRRHPSAFAAAAVAAGLAAACFAGWAAFDAGLVTLPGLTATPAEQAFRTAVGQRAVVTLPDGSVVTLDTDTLIRTRETRRDREITLERGRAFFRVAKDTSRPFVVTSDGKRVTATGTQFDVSRFERRFEVTLIEGQVRVDTPVAAPGGPARRYARVAQMSAGSRLTTLDGASWALAPVDIKRATSWTGGKLSFDNDPLAAVVAELNRYSLRKIVIRDPAIARTPVIGVFKSSDPEGFVRAIEAYRLARVARVSDKEIVLAAPDKKKSNSSNP